MLLNTNNFSTIMDANFTIENFSSFCDRLYDRFHILLNHHEIISKKYTLLINLLNRADKNGLKNKELVYVGTRRQREFLGNKQDFLDINWQVLYDIKLKKDTSKVSSSLYEQFDQGRLSLNTIKPYCLGDYFSIFAEIGADDIPIKKVTKYIAKYIEDKCKEGININISLGQQHEYPIIRYHFNHKEDLYISLPIIQFAHFDGVVHIIFKKEEVDAFDQKTIRFLIKQFSRIYENLLLGWDFTPENIHKASFFNLEQLKSREYYEKNNTNPILKDLKYRKYYEMAEWGILQRIMQAAQVSEIFMKHKRQNAITAILIDSFAHNISAHSLTVLKWWFQQRAELRFRKKEDGISPEFETKLIKQLEVADKIIQHKSSLSNEIHPLLKFLLEKGAFWSGMIREQNFGGEIVDLFTILWEDFINNPLYLGTIAYSEGIKKLNIDLTILADDERIGKKEFIRRKVIQQNENGDWLNGRFVSIDLTKDEGEEDKISKQLEKQHPELKTKSYFVDPTERYPEFKAALSNIKLFLPSGVVGKHALFTMIENEIRNVKHFGHRARRKMQREGLTLNITVGQIHIDDDAIDSVKPKEMYKFAIGIKHRQFIDPQVFTSRLEGLRTDIMEENFRPKLGGTFQDKICAAMLFNNRFVSVQDYKTDRDQRYYPWLKFASSVMSPREKQLEVEKGAIRDFEVSLRRYTEQQKKHGDFYDICRPIEGHLKKIFHIWKGADLYKVSNDEELDFAWENILRFKFLQLLSKGEAFERHFQKIRREGLVRIIQHPVSTVEKAYSSWLSNWVKPKQKDSLCRFSYEGETALCMTYQNGHIQFFNKQQLDELSDQDYDALPWNQEQCINIEHSSDKIALDTCSYRSHGTFIRYFCEGEAAPYKAVMSKVKAAELFEIMHTNICIFDNRIDQRLYQQEEKRKLFTEQLHCSIFKEDDDLWAQEKKKGLHRYHFLVMHLSFIEQLMIKNNQVIDKENINKFIRDEIIGGQDIKALRKNFMLVITTGRGRTKWWTNLIEEKPEYATFTTFRSVESLISSVENAVSLKDDIDLKCRLCKVLFGS